MRTDRELLEDALCLIDSGTKGSMAYDITREIRARLAEKEDDPVAWMDDAGMVIPKRKFRYCEEYESFHIPLYRHPPRPTGLDQLIERIRFLEQQIAERTNQ